MHPFPSYLDYQSKTDYDGLTCTLSCFRSYRCDRCRLSIINSVFLTSAVKTGIRVSNRKETYHGKIFNLTTKNLSTLHQVQMDKKSDCNRMNWQIKSLSHRKRRYRNFKIIGWRRRYFPFVLRAATAGARLFPRRRRWTSFCAGATWINDDDYDEYRWRWWSRLIWQVDGVEFMYPGLGWVILAELLNVILNRKTRSKLAAAGNGNL